MSTLDNQWTKAIQVLKDGRVSVNLGPMNLRIVSERQGTAFIRPAIVGAEHAINALTDIALFRPVTKRPAAELQIRDTYPDVIKRMITACKNTAHDLTPMAAVAGAISDIVADTVKNAGATKVVVDNGGDIAVRVTKSERAKIGIIPRAHSTVYTRILDVRSRHGIGGVATSGVGGRGFTKGIASAAVALAETAALADACSTALGNATIDRNVTTIKKRAEELDPDTDISGQLVTLEVGPLSMEQKLRAAKKGIEKARELVSRRLLVGALIFVDEICETYPNRLPLRKVVQEKHVRDTYSP